MNDDAIITETMHDIDMGTPISPRIRYEHKCKCARCGRIQSAEAVICEDCGSYDLEDFVTEGELMPVDVIP